MRPSRWIAWLGVACLLLLAAPFVLYVAGGVRFSPIGAVANLASALGLVGLGLLIPASMCVAALERRLAPNAMVAGLACCAAAFIGWSVLRFMPVRTPAAERAFNALMVVSTALSAAGGVFGLAGLLVLFPQPLRIGRMARAATILAAAALGLFVTGAVAWYWLWATGRFTLVDDDASYTVTMIAVVLGIIVVLCMLAVVMIGAWPALAHDADGGRGATDGGASSARPAPGAFVVQLRCPRCGERQSLASGGAACAACGLRIRVEAA